jgi:uncharacterized membrane protein YhaH (DUF805 family)
MNWYLSVLKNYVGFSGRARRTEYWMFALISFVITVVLGIIDRMIGSNIPGYLYSLAVLLPALAVGARRLHDTGKSGWLMLLVLIPIIGWIALLVFFVSAGNVGSNAYGADPKQVPAIA